MTISLPTQHAPSATDVAAQVDKLRQSEQSQGVESAGAIRDLLNGEGGALEADVETKLCTASGRSY